MSALPEEPELQLDAPREEVLQQAARLIVAGWSSFDAARPGQPRVDDHVREMLREGLPDQAVPVARRAGRGGPDPGREHRPATASLLRVRRLVRPSDRGRGRRPGFLLRHQPGRVRGAASEIEEQAVRWVGELIGFPVGGGAFTSGGTIAT